MSLMVLQAGPSGPSGGGFTPADVAGLVLWLDASEGTYQSTGGSAALADGDPVGEWQDQSGEGNDFTQTTGASKPTLKTGANGLNGLPVLWFDGIDDTLASVWSKSQPVTVFAVARERVNTNWTSLFRGGVWIGKPQYPTMMALYAGTHLGNTTADTSWHLYTGIANGASSVFRIDGVTKGSGNAGSTGIEDPSLAVSGGSGPGQWDVATILVYDSVLSADNLALLNTYLTDRYGL